MNILLDFLIEAKKGGKKESQDVLKITFGKEKATILNEEISNVLNQ